MTDKMVLTITNFLLTLFIFSNLAFGQESQFGYRVTESGKTVIQIARDVYNDERQWKKIAYWNNLTPPYALSVGQVLALPMQPKIKLSEKNFVSGAAVPAPQFLKQLPSVSRVILNRNGYYVYEVNERAPSLSMVALENFGDKTMAKIIARWNGLSAHDRLSLGQKLIFHEKPTLTTAQSNSVLVKEWSRFGNGEMVQRLTGRLALPTPVSVGAAPKVESVHNVETPPVETQAPPASTTTFKSNTNLEKIAPLSSTNESGAVPPLETTKRDTKASAPIEKPAEVNTTRTETTHQPSSVTVSPSPAVVPAPVSLPAPISAAIPSIPAPAAAAIPSLPSLPTSKISNDSHVDAAREPVVQDSKKLPEKKVQSIVTEPTNLGQPINTMSLPTPNVFNPSDDPELQPVFKNSGTSVAAPQPVETATHATAPPPQNQVPQTVQQPSQLTTAPAIATTAPTTPVKEPVTATDSGPTVAPTTASVPAPTQNPPQAPKPQEPERQPSSTPADSTLLAEPTTDSYWLGSDTMRIMKSISKPTGK